MPIVAVQRKNVAELVAWCGDNPDMELIGQALFESTSSNWIEGVITLIGYLPADELSVSQIVSLPAFIALQLYSLEMARRLVQCGADPSLVSTNGDWKNYNALQTAVYRNDNVLITKYLAFYDEEKVKRALDYKGAAELTPLMMALNYGYLDIAALLATKSDPSLVYGSGTWKNYNILQRVTYDKLENFILAFAEHPQFDAALRAISPRGAAHVIAVERSLKPEIINFLKLNNAARLKRTELMELVRGRVPVAEVPATFEDCLRRIADNDDFARMQFGERNWLHLLSKLQYHPHVPNALVQNAAKKVLQFYHPYFLVEGESLFIDLAHHDPYELSTLVRLTYDKLENFILAFAEHPQFDAALRAISPGGAAHVIAIEHGLKPEVINFLKPSNVARLKRTELMELVRGRVPVAEVPATFEDCLRRIADNDDFARMRFGERNWLHLLSKLQYHPHVPNALVQNAAKKVLQFYHPYFLVEGKSLFIDLAHQDPYELSTLVRPSDFIGVDEQAARMNRFFQTVIDNPASENHFLLLGGTPGVGKTALINELAKRKGFKLIKYKQGDKDDRWVGQLETRIREFFAGGIRESATQPVCLFVDEIDAILPESPPASESSGFDWNKVTTLFQQEIGDLKGHRVALMGATNYLDRLKPAIKRHAGISVMFSLPTLDNRERLIQDFFRFAILENNTTIIQRLARATPGWSPSDLKKFIEGVPADRLAGGRSPLLDLSIERHFEVARAEMAEPRVDHIAMIAPRLSVPVAAEPLIALDRKMAEARDVLSDFIADPGSYTRIIPGYSANTLLYGYPGTGKTALARAVVEGSNCCCFIVDASKMKGITKVFARAKSCERAIIFIDEFDKFACDASPVRELFQVEMDGFAREGGSVVVIAATNYLDRIAEPMLSRFRLKVEAPLPNRENRADLFTGFLKDIRTRAADLFDVSLNVEIEAGCTTLAARREGLSIRDIRILVDNLFVPQIRKRNLIRAGRAAEGVADAEPLLTKLLRAIDEFLLPIPSGVVYPGLFRPMAEVAAGVRAAAGGAGRDDGVEAAAAAAAAAIRR